MPTRSSLILKQRFSKGFWLVLVEERGRGGGRFGKGLQKWRLYEMLTKASTNYERLVPGGMCQNRSTGLCKKNANKFR